MRCCNVRLLRALGIYFINRKEFVMEQFRIATPFEQWFNNYFEGTGVDDLQSRIIAKAAYEAGRVDMAKMLKTTPEAIEVDMHTQFMKDMYNIHRRPVTKM